MCFLEVVIDMRRITYIVIAFTIFLLVTGIIVKMEAPMNMYHAKRDMKLLSSLTDEGFPNKVSDGIYKKNGLLVDTNKKIISTSDNTAPLEFTNTEILSMDLIDEIEIYEDSKIISVPVRGVFITLRHSIYRNDYLTSTIFFKVGDN